MEKDRINHLDGLRCVAIVMVLCFHFFHVWTLPHAPQTLYPYGDTFANFFLFNLGFDGVELFFMVSGFVIALTLRRCSTLWEFAVRRFARLFPTMALCSLITYAVASTLPGNAFRVSAWDFMPALTFALGPSLSSLLVPTHPSMAWMDPSYWSILVEVRFYALASLVFMLAPRAFPRNFLVLCGLLFVADATLGAANHPQLRETLRSLAVVIYLPWFLIGMGYFHCFAGSNVRIGAVSMGVGIAAWLFNAHMWHDAHLVIAGVLLPALFVASFRVSWLTRLLSLPWLTKVGSASYSLYLLHQVVGIDLIRYIASAIHLTGPIAALLTVPVGAVLILLSLLIYTYYEQPLNRLLATTLIKVHAPDPAVAQMTESR